MAFDNFDRIYHGCAADDLSKSRRWRLCRPRIIKDGNVYRRPGLQHGPTSFKWYLPIVIKIVACRSWGVQWRGGFNLWIYTRWNYNRCIGLQAPIRLVEVDVKTSVLPVS